MRVLIAEDDPVSRQILEIMLYRWGYDVLAVCDGQEAWQALSQPGAPTLVILDWMMPRMSGVEVCRRVRAARGDGAPYIILLTARNRQEDVVEGLEAGADDYITKPFDSGELRVRLQTATRIADLQDDLASARRALAERASHDFLTGLWSRPAILDALGREVARAGRSGEPVSILLIDLDHFAAVNETFGWRRGDSVLSEAAGRIVDAIRPYDLIGRYGGEAFLVVLPATEEGFARKVGQRLRGTIAERPFCLSAGEGIPVTASLGLAVLDRLDDDASGLIAQAETSLRAAKDAGGNRLGPGSRTSPVTAA